MRRFVLGLIITLFASGTFAQTAGTNLFLPSVGRGQGSCPEGVCSQWATSAWVYNPNNHTASVTVYFLERDKNNNGAPTITVNVPPNTVKEYYDIIAGNFLLDDVYGALRFVSNTPVVVNGRIFDRNVKTNKGTGSAGQFLAGTNSLASIGSGQSTEVIGLASSSTTWRSNVGLVEVTGKSVNVKVERLAGNGNVLGTQTYNVKPFEAKQFNATTLGGADGTNQRVRFTVTGGNGRIIATASRIDSKSGDPSTINQSGEAFDPRVMVGNWDGAWYNHTFGSTGAASLQITYNAKTQTLTVTADLDGNVFGGSNPPPETITTTLGPTGFRVTRDSAYFGDIDVTIDTRGRISGGLDDPGGGIVAVDVDGALNDANVMIRYVVDLGGGQTAVGLVWFDKS